MAVEFAGTLFAHKNKKGASLLVSVSHAHRYSIVTSGELMGMGLHDNIHSVELVTTSEADGNLVLLNGNNFSGSFVQLTAAASFGDAMWNPDGHARSVILVAGKRQGKSEVRLSFRDQFLHQWEKFLDDKLAGGRASRHGKPTLTWEMFPASMPPLDPEHIYLKIHQRLHISMPWPYVDYAASMTYHIHLFVNGQHRLRASGARWSYWVESGIKAGHISGDLEPKVKGGLPTLVHQVNANLSKLDSTASISGVYYLPGKQLTPLGTGSLTGHTSDDVTIVVEF
jgi:hypothetical protein